jgi:hypothetical protein
MSRIGTHKTVVLQQDNSIEVYYHNTRVVFVSGDYITLDSGPYGQWQTATTKKRMNQTSEKYNLGYRVFQKNYNWFVEFEGETIPFHKSGNMVLKKGQGKLTIGSRTNNPSY